MTEAACIISMELAVFEVLEQACSQDPVVLKPAEQTLRQWETQRGFYTALFNVFSNRSCSLNVRWIAVLYFKNGVDKYWRRNAPNEIAADEKEFLRNGLLAKFDEPVNQLAVQLAVLISKIARYDCPKEWGSLIPTILDVIRSDNPLQQHRALLTFHHVVKTFASKRLAPDKKLFQELTSNVFNFFLNFWNTYTESFFALTSSGASSLELQESLDKALLSLRILGKLVVNGISKPSENQHAMMFLKVLLERAKTSLDCRKSLEARGIQLEVCDKFIIHFTKILQRVLDIHPLCYVDLIPSTLEFTVFYCFTELGQPLTFERFIIQCLNLLKKILQEYKPAKIIEETKHPLTLRAHQLKQEFFTPEILTEICMRLVTRYFVLTSSDLEDWDADPENFGVDDCGESWKYSLRPCTETIFLAILHQYKDVLSNVLVELMQKHHQLVDPNDLHGILLKDAVYNAVGLAGFDLYDEVNFDQWFSTTLKQELNVKTNNYRIIRRRVCWLIGRWTGVKLSLKLRPDLYCLMVKAMNPSEDLRVKLAASEALKLAIDDFQFHTDDFAPFLEPSFSLLFSLLKEVKECDTKMRVLYVLSFIIERVGSGVKPYIGSLNAYLPGLWKHSECHNMLRCAIVSTLVHVEKALGSDCVALQPLVIDVIQLSCDMSQAGHVYLLDDGLELWLALLENTPAPCAPGIAQLFKIMPTLLECSSENLRLCLYIIQAYVLLSPQEFFSDVGHAIVESIRSILGDLRDEGIVMAMRLIESCLRASLNYGTRFVQPLLLGIFESVYKGDECPMVLTMHLAIVARIILTSRDVFTQAIGELAKQLGQGTTEVFAQVMGTYVSHMPLVTEQKKSKLLALGLCTLIDANCPPAILQLFPQMITNIVETLNDVTKINEVGCAVDSLMIEDYQSLAQFEDVQDYETEHSQRKRKLAFGDPVHCIVLAGFLQQQLNGLRAAIGDKLFEQMMQSLNAEVEHQLRDYVTV